MAEKPSGTFRQTSQVFDTMQVISASDELFNHVDEGLPMWVSDGDRSLRFPFEFTKSFDGPPTLILGVVGMDCDHSTNLRYILLAENIAGTGFDVVFKTWGDTRIARVSIAWHATGRMSANTASKPKHEPIRPKTVSPNRPVQSDL